jgi:hypothetical protein
MSSFSAHAKRLHGCCLQGHAGGRAFPTDTAIKAASIHRINHFFHNRTIPIPNAKITKVDGSGTD